MHSLVSIQSVRRPERDRNLDKHEIHYAIETQPSFVPGQLPLLTLSGWAFSSQGPLTLEVILDEVLLLSFRSDRCRDDVYRGHFGSPYSLLSGFELSFPERALADVSAGRLSLRARSGDTSETIWSWGGGAVPGNAVGSTKEIREFLQRQKRQLSQARIADTPDSLSVFLPSCFAEKDIGLISSLKAEADSREVSLKVYCPQSLSAALSAALSEALDSVVGAESATRSDTLSLVPDAEMFSQLSAVARKGKDSDLLFWIEGGCDVSFLSAGDMLADYLQLPEISLLCPALYGSGELSAAAGIALADIRSAASVKGASVPALSLSSRLASVWLSSCGVLRDVFSLQGSKDGLDRFRGLLEQNVPLHVDLRQPLQRSGNEHPFYPAKEKMQMQFMIDNQLSFSNSDGSEQRVFFVLPDNWKTQGTLGVERRQILNLARYFKAEGANVCFVADCDEPERDYFYTYSVLSLEAFKASRFAASETQEDGWIIATHWRAVRAAHAMRYHLALPVIAFFQEQSEQHYQEFGREHLDLCRWAYQSLPLVISSSAAVQASTEVPDAVLPIGVSLLDTLSPQAVQAVDVSDAAKKARVLCVFADHTAPFTRSILQAIAALKQAVPNLAVTMVDARVEGNDSAELVLLADSLVRQPADSSLQELYDSHDVLIDFRLFGTESSVCLEAASAGLLALCATRDAVGSIPWTVDVSDAAGFATEVAGILTNAARQQKVSETLSADCQQKVASIEPGFSELLAQRYRDLKEKSAAERSDRRGVSVILPIYCALDATVQCIRSLLKYAPEDYELILVNDVSDRGTTRALRAIVADNPRLQLIDKKINGGFVQSCLSGYAAAKPENDIVLLNSDVVLTESTLDALQNAAYARGDIGLASVLSTNSPHLQIELNPGDSLESAARTIRSIHSPTRPTVVTPEGQLLYIRRWALDRFGFFDSVYNRGFCEESDLCMRMYLHGVDMVVADDTLILHRKSESFGLEGGLQYKRENRPIFDARWARYYWTIYPLFLERDPLQGLRSKYAATAVALEGPKAPLAIRHLPDALSTLSQQNFSSRRTELFSGGEVVFLVPSVILGGGTLSVLQHANELMLRGIEARVLSLSEPDPIPFPWLAPPIAVSPEQLLELNWTNQKLVATFWLTSYYVKAVSQRYQGVSPYYYIQDYEPWFYSRPDHMPTIAEVEKTYELGLRGVAKTNYLQDVVTEHHGGVVDVITPGVARTVFYEGTQDQHLARPRVTAYFRPRTPRRGGKECIEVLKRVKQRVPETKICLFGESAEEHEELSQLFEFKGKLAQSEVAKLYRETDVVLDMSFWHGFGRMGIEGMASGAVPVLSDSGGVRRYAIDGENSFIVPHDAIDLAVERIVLLLKDRELRMRMRQNALEMSRSMSEQKAVDDWLDIFEVSGFRSDSQAGLIHGVEAEVAATRDDVSEQRAAVNKTAGNTPSMRVANLD